MIDARLRCHPFSDFSSLLMLMLASSSSNLSMLSNLFFYLLHRILSGYEKEKKIIPFCTFYFFLFFL